MFDKKLQSLLEEKTFMIEVLTAKALAMKAEIESLNSSHNDELDQAVKEAAAVYEKDIAELNLSIDNLNQLLVAAEKSRSELETDNKRLNQIVKELYGKLHDLYEEQPTVVPDAASVENEATEEDDVEEDGNEDDEVIVRKMDNSFLKKNSIPKPITLTNKFDYGNLPNRGWYFYNRYIDAYHWRFVLGYLKTIFPGVAALDRALLSDKYSSFYVFSLIGVITGETTNDVVICEEYKDDAVISVSGNYKGFARPFDRLMFIKTSICKIVVGAKDKFGQSPLDYNIESFLIEAKGSEPPDFSALSAKIKNLV